MILYTLILETVFLSLCKFQGVSPAILKIFSGVAIKIKLGKKFTTDPA